MNTQVDPAQLTSRFMFVKRDIPRDISLTKVLTSEICARIHRHACSGPDHTITLVKDAQGLQLYSCCVGGFMINAPDIADPYLLTLEDPKELFVAICEYFYEKKDFENQHG